MKITKYFSTDDIPLQSISPSHFAFSFVALNGQSHCSFINSMSFHFQRHYTNIAHPTAHFSSSHTLSVHLGFTLLSSNENSWCVFKVCIQSLRSFFDNHSIFRFDNKLIRSTSIVLYCDVKVFYSFKYGVAQAKFK